MELLNKKELKQYRVGNLRVYLVNGTFVRKHYDVGWTMGGHNWVYSYVPKTDIWIDQDLSPMEQKYTLLHELAEIRAMNQGLSYDDAHDRYGNLAEGKARHGGDVDEMIKREMEKLPTILEPSHMNGHIHSHTHGSPKHHEHKIKVRHNDSLMVRG